ncbi:hypothetical protein DD606_23915 [Enterobacter cloacae complex sp. GF14B]|nr:hypothetical protein DD606_23915 [Enterobacter cloacae complex sp. GF14B]
MKENHSPETKIFTDKNQGFRGLFFARIFLFAGILWPDGGRKVVGKQPVGWPMAGGRWSEVNGRWPVAEFKSGLVFSRAATHGRIGGSDLDLFAQGRLHMAVSHKRGQPFWPIKGGHFYTHFIV